MRIAFDAARAEMTAASRTTDTAAARVARDTALPAAAMASGPAPATPPAYLSGDLVSAVPDLMVARDSFALNVVSARYADDAYRSALGLLDR